MARRTVTDNEVAALLAFIAGVIFVIIGWNGPRIADTILELIAGATPGPDPALRTIAVILGWIAPFSGAIVIAGAILLLYDRVRAGKLVVLFGTGAGIISLILFIVLLIRRPFRILAHEGVVPALFGVLLSVAARLKAKVPSSSKTRRN